MAIRSVNSVNLVGVLGKKPEIITTEKPDGTPLHRCKVRMTTNESYPDGKGSFKTRTEWLNLIFWNEKALNVAKYGNTKTPIIITGSLKNNYFGDNTVRISEVRVDDAIYFTTKGSAGKDMAESVFPSKNKNEVELVGYLGKEPELVSSQKSHGTPLHRCSVSLATNESYPDGKGGYKETTDWHNLVFWGSDAEVIAKYGSTKIPILVKGSIRSNNFTNNEGKTIETTQIRVNEFIILGSKRDSIEVSNDKAEQVATTISKPVDETRTKPIATKDNYYQDDALNNDSSQVSDNTDAKKYMGLSQPSPISFSDMDTDGIDEPPWINS